jgi:hypothetical protein
MGPRSLISFPSAAALALAGALAGCPSSAPQPPAKPSPTPSSLPEKVVADFEAAVLSGREAFEGLFDFAAVGEMEILLHRYDLNGRLVNLPEDMKAAFAAEDGTPYPAERERRNVGNFYKRLAQRTVGTGGCVAGEPRTKYGKRSCTRRRTTPAATTSSRSTTTEGASIASRSAAKQGSRCPYTPKESPRDD